jgi:ribosomal large subunit pseudouridine synthase D (EC 5.4.99.-)
MAKLTTIIPDELAGMRLDQCLAEVFPDYSRSKLQIWIKAGRVTVNQKLLKAKR